MLSPEDIIARVDSWRNAKSIILEPQTGGKTNQNFLVKVDGEKFILRLSGENTTSLGIRREVERDAILAAAGIGVAPEVVAFLLPEGHLITRYIAGVEWSGDDFKRPEIIVRVAEALRRVHALAPIAGVFDPYRDIELRLSTANERAIPLPNKIDQMLQKLRGIESARTQALAGHLTLCHNDPWANNFLDDSTVRLLDWEFAGMGDPYFDLASVAIVYSKETRAAFLKAYFGEEKPGALDTLEQMIFVVMFWNAAWALMQIGTPSAEYDYTAMARKMFNFIEALE